MTLLLEGGRVIDPAAGLDAAADVLIVDGAVAAVGPDAAAAAAADVERIDVSGLVVCPGFIDMHVHFREPGQEWKETVASGTRAAAAGGFAAVACMANTIPVNDSRSVTELIVRQARDHGQARVHPIGAITKGMAGEELAEFHDMLEAGAVAFSDDGKPVMSSLIMRRALEYAQIFDVPVIDHCEDSTLVDGGVMNEGDLSLRLGLRGWPAVAEDVMVQRDLLLAEYTGGRIHIAHLSTARAAEFVREAKRRGVRASCEITPHHLVLDESAVASYDTNAKMNPPLRAARDRDALLQALADGTCDAIATDHAPHHCDEKCVEFSLAPLGVIGLETAVPICLDRLVHAGVVDLPRLVELFTSGPAAVLGLDAGTLEVGRPGDVTVLDPERRTVIEPDRFESMSRNTPFARWELRGRAVMTIVGGRVVHDARETTERTEA